MSPIRPHRLTFLLSLLILAAAGSSLEILAAGEPKSPRGWPETRRENLVEQLHGVDVADPYRWLEKADDPAVMEWMKAQDEFARAHLTGLPARSMLEERFKQLFYIDAVSPPYHKGKRYFYTRNHADKEKAIVYMREGEKGKEQVLFDPNRMSEDGSIALRGWTPSYDGRYVGYKLSKNNADASTMYVRNVAEGRDLETDVIEGAKYANPSWTPDSRGFYYTWLPTDPSIAIEDLPGHSEVRFHRLGEDPKTDKVIHPALGDPTTFIGADVSRDGRWLLLYVQHGWARSDIYMKDLKAKEKGVMATVGTADAAPPPGIPTEQAGFRSLAVGQDALYQVIAWNGRFYIFTNEGAPRYRVLKVDPRKPERANWREIVPERADATLDQVDVIGDRLVLLYLKNALSELEVRTLEGEVVRKVELPALGSVTGITGNPDEDDAYFKFASYTDMPQVFRTSIHSGKTSLWEEIKFPIDVSKMTTDQVWYTSKDGTRVSMFIVHRRDMVRNGDNPMLMTGYGGFNSGMTPYFSPTVALWVEHGGVFAVPNLRGGNEYGEEWHRAGMLEHKQNVFDDFIAAAEYLIAEKYTRPERMAIKGGSNGGLLVGAAMTQRPDLFRVVVCGAPLLDMVRYHRFGSGKTWIGEYGSADDPQQFPFLLAYSPYHRVKAGTAYPALLMLSPDSDDRVDPMHARKFVAAIQWATSSDQPVWMRVEKHAGHGGADLVRQAVEESADSYAFIFDRLGMN